MDFLGVQALTRIFFAKSQIFFADRKNRLVREDALETGGTITE